MKSVNKGSMSKQGKPAFIPGIELAECFYRDAVKPILDAGFPGLRHSAALIGPGSEVLGFDDEMSTDHHWGPRVMIFLLPKDFKSKTEAIHALLAGRLPLSFRGYSTNFTPPDPHDNGVRCLSPTDTGPVNHRVEFLTVAGFFKDYLGIEINRPLTTGDWLALPFQKLRSITAGCIFHDDLGLANAVRRLTWYPHDVWLYVMASLWARIGQEEHLMGRAGVAGDEIGSAIIGSRLARDVTRLVFLMERVYPPYAKWLGTAFAELRPAKKLKPLLASILHAQSWREREKPLAKAYSILARLHNDLAVTETMQVAVSRFWSRPFQVIKADRFKDALLEKITDPCITTLLRRSPIGSIDIFSDNTDLLEDPAFRPAIRRLFE